MADTITETDRDAPRSTSATSSLDPYYFTNLSRDESPALVTEEGTPSRESILRDRRGLVGLGELQTPRWTEAPSFLKDKYDEAADDDSEVVLHRRASISASDDDRDSPWTIEAIDGELEEAVHVSYHMLSVRISCLASYFYRFRKMFLRDTNHSPPSVTLPQTRAGGKKYYTRGKLS